MNKPPHNKCPVCPVPDSADKESDHNIPILPDFSTMASSQWYIDIGCQPTGQRYMPSPPEIGNACGQVRMIKVVDQIKPD